MSVFRRQLEGVAGAFERWGDCERTVLACTLARRVPWPGLRLLQTAVDAALTCAPPPDERLEREANDEALLSALLATRGADDDDEAGERLQRLLALLPLLRPDNERAKDAYVHAAPALVQRCVDAPRRRAAAERCRRLLCCLLVHPAIAPHEHSTLTQWLHFLESHIAGLDGAWPPRAEPPAPAAPAPPAAPANIWGSGTFRRTIGKNVEFRVGRDHAPFSGDHNAFSGDHNAFSGDHNAFSGDHNAFSGDHNAFSGDHAPFNSDLQESFSKNGRDVDISLEGDKLTFDATIAQPKSQRSNSLTPPSSTFLQASSSAENLSEPFQKPRSFSLCSDRSLAHLRPVPGLYGTTGSETRLDELRSNKFVEYPGMSTVAQWLKSLRLHKYVWLFTNISYDQMMAIDEEYLEKLGVTLGARHKLLLSIARLRERRGVLLAMARDLRGGAAPARLLPRLQAVLLSPMPPASDLPQLIVTVLELASTALISGAAGAGAGGEDAEGDNCDPLSLHCWLVEQALHHESFTGLTAALRRLRHRLPPRQFYRHVCATPLRQRAKPRWRPPPPLAARRWTAPGGGCGAVGAAGAVGAVGAPRGKSHSYPCARAPPHSRACARAPPHDYASLDALCLQMTEQAIN